MLCIGIPGSQLFGIEQVERPVTFKIRIELKAKKAAVGMFIDFVPNIQELAQSAVEDANDTGFLCDEDSTVGCERKRCRSRQA
jgi:hypothetical protein